MKIVGLTILLLISGLVYGQKSKSLAPTPPMGWNSWNWFGKSEINEQNMRECIEKPDITILLLMADGATTNWVPTENYWHIR